MITINVFADPVDFLPCLTVVECLLFEITAYSGFKGFFAKSSVLQCDNVFAENGRQENLVFEVPKYIFSRFSFTFYLSSMFLIFNFWKA